MSSPEAAQPDDRGVSSASGVKPWGAPAGAVIALYALLAILVVPVYPHFISSNEFSHWALTVALVEGHTAEITPLMPLIGAGLEDIAVNGNRVFSNKAPGISFLSIPAYIAARASVGLPDPENLRITLNEMRLLCATVPVLLLAGGFIFLARRFSIDRDRVAMGVFELLFATPLLAYGLLLYSHALVAAALFGAWILLHVSEREGYARHVAAGALLGIAVACEYTSAVPVLVLTISAISRERWKSFAAFVAGGVPFAIFLAIYHHATFGGILEVPSGHEQFGEFRQMASSGLFGIQFPSPVTFLRLMFDPAKGLVVFSPFLLLAVAAWRPAKRAMSRRAWLTLIAVPAAIVVLHSGYANWHGGWTVGARYLVPALPFLVAPLLFRKITRIELLLVGVALAVVVPTSLVFPFVPAEVPLPWISFSGWLLGRGLVIPNLLHFVSRPLAVALPFALVAAAATLSARRRTGWILAGIAAGLLLSLAAIQVFPPHRIVRYERAYTEEVYFDRAGSLEKEFPGERLPEFVANRRIVERHKPPATWPF